MFFATITAPKLRSRVYGRVWHFGPQRCQLSRNAVNCCLVREANVRKWNPKATWKEAASISVLFTDKQKALLENCPALVDVYACLSVLLFIVHFYWNACMNTIFYIPLTLILSLKHSECQSKCTIPINMYVWQGLDDYISGDVNGRVPTYFKIKP